MESYLEEAKKCFNKDIAFKEIQSHLPGLKINSWRSGGTKDFLTYWPIPEWPTLVTYFFGVQEL